MTPLLTRIAAHRGGAREKPENTLEAFDHAIQLNVEEIELDVHLSADNVVMVHHDATLDRMTSATGPLRGKSSAELNRLRIKGTINPGVPTLEETLSLLAPSSITLRMELKTDHTGTPYPSLPERAMRLVERFGMADRTIITSFQLGLLRCGPVVEAKVPTILLTEESTYQAVNGLEGIQALLGGTRDAHFALPIDSLTDQRVEKARERGLTISAFGCHEEPDIVKAYRLGLPVITSDRPHLAKALRASLVQANRSRTDGKPVSSTGPDNQSSPLQHQHPDSCARGHHH